MYVLIMSSPPPIPLPPPLSPTQGPATAVAFSRTGEHFASGGADEQVSSKFIIQI